MIDLYTWADSNGNRVARVYCAGHHGMWACDDPDHLLPLDMFQIDRSGFFKNELQHRCILCTGMRNRIISLVEKYIPQKIRRKHPLRKEMHLFAVEVFKGNKTEHELNDFIRASILNISPAQECIDWMESKSKPKKSNIATFFYPPEHEKALKDAGRSAESAIKARKAQKVDGFIYTATHPSWPEIKIGFTFNPPSRLSTFNTCCPHKLFCMPYISTYLRNAKAGEDEVHKTLDGFRAEGEWFNISLELAVSTIKDYVESLDDTEK